MKKILLLALLILAFPAQEAWAKGCSCGSVQAIVTMAHMQTVQAVNAVTAAEAASIRSEILLAAQNIIGTIKTESATIVRAIIALKESNVVALKGQAVAGEAMKTEDMYGKAAQPAGLCGASSVGAGIQLGAQAGREIHGTMREKQLAYSNTPGARPVEFLNRVLADEHPTEKETVDALFPLESTLTEDQVAQAHESIKTLANPRPLPVVTDSQKSTPAGQTYAAAKKIHEARLAAEQQAFTDPLTGLCNRRGLENALANLGDAPFVIGHLDLDHFKALNDERGHEAGDSALRLAARALKYSTRDSDIVARFGGDEFAILLPNSAHADCSAICANILRNINEAMTAESFGITASIGSRTFDIEPDSPSSAIKQADGALYTAKTLGRNQFVSM